MINRLCKLTLTLLLTCLPGLSANRFFINGGVDSLYGTSGNWSTTSGGGGGAGVPTSADAVFFDASSPNCTVSSARVALSVDFTGYTNTITLNGTLTASGSATLSTGMTSAGSSALIINATATLTSNGKTWVPPLTMNGTSTMTLADNWTVTGLVTVGASSLTTTVNGNQITANGGFTAGVSTGVVTGTTVISATGTITGPSSSGSIRLPLTVNTGSTFASGDFRFNASTLTCNTGTVTATSSNLVSASAGPTTIDCPVAIWSTITFSFATTYSLTHDLTCTGLFTAGAGSSTQTINSNKVNAGGGFRVTNTSSTLAGTTEVVLTGTGQVDAPSLTTGRIALPITVSAGGGTVTFATPIVIDVGLLKVNTGTVVAGNTWPAGPAPPLGRVTVQ